MPGVSPLSFKGPKNFGDYFGHRVFMIFLFIFFFFKEYDRSFVLKFEGGWVLMRKINVFDDQLKIFSS